MEILKFISLLLTLTLCLLQARCRSNNSNKSVQLVKLPTSAAEVIKTIDTTCTLHTNSSATVKGFGLQFHMPFMDMTIEHKHNLHIAQEIVGNQLYVVHGHELYVIELSRERKHISLVGFLSDSLVKNKLLGVQVIIWHEYLLLVVAMADELEIYQLEKALIENRISVARKNNLSNEMVPQFDPIQQLTLLGQYRRHFLITTMDDHFMLLVADSLTKVLDKLSTYQWIGTYFDPIEELTMPQISTINIIGTEPKYLIAGRIAKSSQGKSALTMYELMLPSLKLKQKQTLTVRSRRLHAFTYHKKNYLITCSFRQPRCNSFNMINGQFEVHKQRSSEEIGFDLITAAEHFLVGAYNREIRIYRHARLDCYTSFKSNMTDVAVIYAYANAKGEEFIILHYRREASSLLRFVEIEAEGGMLLGAMLSNVTESEESNDQQKQEHHFENSITQLRSMLLKRKLAMDAFRAIANDMSPALVTVKLNNAVHIRSGKIGFARILGKTLSSPVQIIQRADQLRRIQRLPTQQRWARSLEDLTLNKTQLQVKQLRVRNLLFEGDVLPGFYLDRTMQTEPELSLRSKVSTQLLRTKILVTQPNNAVGQLDVYNGLYVRNLKVQNINGIPWTDLYNAFYLKNRNDKVTGNVTLKALDRVRHLRISILNGVTVDQYFNLMQPQVVHSNIFIYGFLANTLRVDRINDLDFVQDLVLRAQNVLIEGPIILYRARITGHIYQGDNSTAHQQHQEFNADNNNVEWQQFYTGKIVINGSLTINRLLCEDDVKTIVSNNTLSIKTIQNNYISVNGVQFAEEEVSFGNVKISAPALNTQQLNSYPIGDYMQNMPLPQSVQFNLSIVPLILVFMDAQIIGGDVSSPHSSSKLVEIARQVVRYGEAANITSVKHFKSPILVNWLYTLMLNELTVDQFVSKSKLAEIEESIFFSGNKTFETISVTQDLTIEHALNSKSLNNLMLSTLLNYNYHIELLSMPFMINAKNVILEQVNANTFDEIFQNMQIHNGHLVLHKKLHIQGNARFIEHLQVNYVNDVAWDTYKRNLIRSNEDNIVVVGKKHFLNDVTVTDSMRMHLLNEQRFSVVLDNVLYKSRPQEIVGTYVFRFLRTGNLDVSIVNDISSSAFIDLRGNTFELESDLHILQLAVGGNMIGRWMHSFDLQAVVTRLIGLERYAWRNVNVLGNVSWPNTTVNAVLPIWQQNFLYLRRNAAQCLGNSNITGNVQLHNPYIDDMQSPANFIAAAELNAIAIDSLRKQNNEKLVKGSKNFLRSLHMRNCLVNGMFDTPLVNEVNVMLFNMSLWRLSSATPILGPLHFQMPPSIVQLHIEGSVNGLQPHTIYSNRKAKLPMLKMRNFYIADKLQLNDINGVPLNYLLKHRMHKSSESLIEADSVLAFEHLELNGNAFFQSINNIAIDSIVYLRSQHLQAIASTKYVAGDVILVGSSHVLWLNDHPIIDAYEESVQTAIDTNYQFEHLIVSMVTLENGLLQPASLMNAKSREHDEDTTQHLTKQQNFIYLGDSEMKIRWQGFNDTSGRRTLHKLIARISSCERRVLQVQWEQDDGFLNLHNATTNTLIEYLDDMTVMAENYCKPRHGKVYCKIKIFNKKFTKVFGMRKHIQTIMSYRSGSNVFILLHASDVSGMRNEIRILRVDSAGGINNWQKITCGKFVQLMETPVLKPVSYHAAILAIADVSRNQPVLNIYTVVHKVQKFNLSQTIEGEYDLMQLLGLEDGRQQLLLSCLHCQHIHVYERKSMMQRFVLRQSIQLRASIDRLMLFTFGDGHWYLFTLSNHEENFYNVYKYTHLSGWLHAGHSFYPNIHSALPLNDDANLSESLRLLLCNNEQHCRLLKAQQRTN